MKAQLDIKTILKDNKTILQHCYYTPPFKILNITEDKRSKDLQLMLMSSSPGILDNDLYQVNINVGSNSSLQLHTQSYQRLFKMQSGATQFFEIHLQEGASFTFLPHPSVPHYNSIFNARNKIYLQNNCKLIWGEILTCGRKENGEIFMFSKYHSITEVFLNNRLIVKDNLLLQPPLVDPTAMGQMEGYTHQANFIYCDVNSNIKLIADKLYLFMAEQQDINFGLSSPSPDIIFIRLFGYKAERLFACLKAIASLISALKSENYGA